MPSRPHGRSASDGEVASAVVAQLAIALAAREIDVEHMDLVVAGDDLAVGRDQEGAVRRLVGRDLDGERADMKIDAEGAGKIAKGGKRGVFLLGQEVGEQRLPIDLHDVGHLRSLHIGGAALFGLLDQLGGGAADCLADAAPSAWQRGRREMAQLCSVGPLMPIAPPAQPAARRGAHPPRAHSRSSQPPTWIAPMKICGTVVRPLARLIISARSSGLPVVSISMKATPLRSSKSLAD